MKRIMIMRCKIRKIYSELDKVIEENKQIKQTIAHLKSGLNGSANDELMIGDKRFVSPRFTINNGPRLILRSVEKKDE